MRRLLVQALVMLALGFQGTFAVHASPARDTAPAEAMPPCHQPAGEPDQTRLCCGDASCAAACSAHALTPAPQVQIAARSSVPAQAPVPVARRVAHDFVHLRPPILRQA